MSDHVITIKKEHIIENTINKSRFIAHIKPVFSEEEAKMFIEEVKQTHKEATHNCSAYTVGNQMNIQKANDDGEPTGTAGIPMLEILIRAYSGAVRDVIYDIGRVELRNAIPTTVTINYDLTGKFEYELASTSFFLRDKVYTDKVSYKIDVVETEYDSFIEFLNRNTASQYDLEKDTPKQLPFDIETN